MQNEKGKGSKLGELIKRAEKEGKIVPFETVVQVLVNGLIATKSKRNTYVVSGFPTSIEQAIYF